VDQPSSEIRRLGEESRCNSKCNGKLQSWQVTASGSICEGAGWLLVGNNLWGAGPEWMQGNQVGDHLRLQVGDEGHLDSGDDGK
jgi:hypothetical protein